MKAVLSFLVAACLVLASAPVSLAEPHQVIQGTQLHLTLLSGINTSNAKDGDPFVAVVTEPIYFGGQLLISAGTRVNGSIGTVNKARRFSLFRGQAYLNLTFRSLEMDGRIIPVQMSILALEKPRGEANGKRRKDVRIEEGQVVEAKHDLKGDLTAGAIGTGGGTLIGMVFSHALRGFGFGFAGSAVYIVARKGKEVELPAQTGILVRTDNTITVPAAAGSGSGYVSNRQ
jgi:hypothetical protein